MPSPLTDLGIGQAVKGALLKLSAALPGEGRQDEERLLGFGRAVEVLEPLPLRRSLLDFAEQIIALYTA
jgi:predicted DNA-binding transcriptional regulator YafY